MLRLAISFIVVQLCLKKQLFLATSKSVTLQEISYLIEKSCMKEDPQESNVPAPEIAAPSTEAPIEAPKKRLVSKKRLLIILPAVLLLLGGGAAAYFITKKPVKTATSATQPANTTPSPSTDASAKVAIVSKAEAVPITTAEATFYSSPKKLDDLKLFQDLNYFGIGECDTQGKNCQPAYTEADFTYYEVGTSKKGEALVVMSARAKTIEGVPQYLFLKNTQGHYNLLARQDNGLRQDLENKGNFCPSCIDKVKNALASGVSVDTSTVFSDLVFPTDLTVAGQKIKTTTGADPQFMPNGLTDIRGDIVAGGKATDPIDATKLGNSGNYTFYKIVTKSTDAGSSG